MSSDLSTIEESIKIALDAADAAMGRNRTDDEMFDLYYETDSRFFKVCQWYGTLSGLFWPFIPFCAVLFAACPRTIGLQLFSSSFGI